MRLLVFKGAVASCLLSALSLEVSVSLFVSEISGSTTLWCGPSPVKVGALIRHLILKEEVALTSNFGICVGLRRTDDQ